MLKMKLSVIIPVYNVEKYIEKTIYSLYKQDLSEDEFEVILINDGSTDKSLDIICNLADKYNNIIILNQSNQGPSIARNNGIIKANGDYILFMDSDDLLINSSLSFMLNIAYKYQLDILKGDYVKANNIEIEKGIERSIPEKFTYIVKTGEQAFIEDYDPMYSYAVLNLFRKDYIISNKIFFLDGKFFEDVAYTIESYLKAKRFMAIPFKFYIYRQHNCSIMATMNLTKLFSMNDVIAYNYSHQYQLHLSHKAIEKLYFSLFASLIVNIWYLSHYRSLYPYRMEIINDLKKKVPNLSFKGSFKQRFVTFCYKYIPNIYISIRYCLAKTKFD